LYPSNAVAAYLKGIDSQARTATISITSFFKLPVTVHGLVQDDSLRYPCGGKIFLQAYQEGEVLDYRTFTCAWDSGLTEPALAVQQMKVAHKIIRH